MHRIIPELITENYRAGRYHGTFRAASMFLDISGFSVMTDALMGQGREGAEVLAGMMRAVFDQLVEAIFAQGGMIVGYAGDSISALYPVETDEARAARRALASAHRIQQRLAAQPLFETPFGSFHISAKVGLALGSVSWGILRSRQDDRAVYYFRGDAIEEAAGAEQQAFAGDIILTDEFRRHPGTDIETEPRGHRHALRRVPTHLPEPEPIALPEVDPAIAATFAPREVVTRDLQGEFRQTVQIFLRIPDLGEDRLQDFMHTCFDLQKRYGGLIDRIDFGDKGCNLIVLWGAPVAHENDMDRALNFVLDLQQQADFPVTAGVTYYMAYAGYIGGQLYETYTAYGWGMNLAARFMMGASERDIWLDERIAQRVQRRFHLEFVGEQSFKGFAQKQKVYVLRGRKGGSEEIFRGKMAGRASELQALADFVKPLWDGKYAGVMGIWGEAGIGKSRLVYEFRRSPAFQDRGFTWATCPSDEILQRSFNPFRYWLVRHFDILPTQDQATRVQRVRAKLDELIAFTGKSSLAAELQRLRSFLATLVDLEWPDSPYEQLDAQARHDNTILALISLLKAESLRQPLILFLEDAQFLDEDSKAFLPRLKRALETDPVSHPIAIVIAARWQGAKILLEDGLVDQEIHLAGLPDESTARLCGDFLGQPAASTVTTLVNERAEGNPFFLEQSLRYLQEQDLLELGPSSEWTLKPEARSAVMPADVRAMLVARLDRLAGPVNEVIQAASVLGRVFDAPTLRRMLANRSSLQNEIAAAEQAGVWSALSETRYIFNHALLRDVAYGMQLQSRRRELHALAFEALKERFAGEIHRHYEELAYHTEQAALVVEARRYLEMAGDAARDEYQNAQALDFYRRALSLLPSTDIRERFRLQRECEKILAERGSLDERTREIESLQALAEATGEPGDLAEVMLLRAWLLSSSGSYDKSAELASRAKELALQLGHFQIAIRACLSLLAAFSKRGMYQEARQHGEAGMALAREHHAMLEQAAILNALGLVVLEMQNPTVARAYFEQSLSIFRAQQNLRGVANVLGNLGLVAGYQGNYTAALDYYEQSLRLLREIGARNAECPRLGNMGWLCGLLGDYPKAQAYAAQSVQIAREVGDRLSETISLINLSSHSGALGDFAAAIDYAKQGLSLAREFNDRNAQAWALTYLGHGLFDSGVREPAREAYQEALDLRYQLAQPALATEPAAGLARIDLTEKDPAGAHSQVGTILVQLEEDGTLEGTDQPLRVYLSCYLVLSEMKDPRANAILNTAHDMLRTRANAIPDPSARKAYLENISYNREILSLWSRRRQGDSVDT
ncbi:MAG TPA: tetratricopeptide repeat protein [Anaerolineales bacterium]